MAAFPYDLSKLLGGATRILYAPISQAAPTKLHDVIDIVSPYAPKAGWVDFGANEGASTYGREFTNEEWRIEQSTSAVLEEPSEVTRRLTISVAELTMEAQKIIEEGSPIQTIAAVGGTNTQQRRTDFGLFEELTQYRVAFISRRKKASGVVTEPGGATRGRFYIGTGYRVQISPDASELQQQKGQLSSRQVQFHFFPEPGTAEGAEHGFFLEEVAGAI